MSFFSSLHVMSRSEQTQSLRSSAFGDFGKAAYDEPGETLDICDSDVAMLGVQVYDCRSSAAACSAVMSRWGLASIS